MMYPGKISGRKVKTGKAIPGAIFLSILGLKFPLTAACDRICLEFIVAVVCLWIVSLQGGTKPCGQL